MKKVLTIFLLVTSLSGILLSADGREPQRQIQVQALSVVEGSLLPLIVQRRRRHRRRWWARRHRRERRRERHRRGRGRDRHDDDRRGDDRHL